MKRTFCLLALLTVGIGCSDSDPIVGSDGEEGAGDDADGGGAGGNTASSASGSGGAPPSPVCPDASDVYAVEPAASNLLFLLDRSGSMHLRVNATDTRWTLTTAGLANILVSVPDQTVAGLAMFPSGDQPVTCCEVTAGNFVDCTCADGELPAPADRCDATTYESLAVSMDALDAAHEAEMISTVAASDSEFYWGTPLAPALGGTLDYDAVNITVTNADGTDAIPRDTSHQNGWDYLPGKEQVKLYGDACESFKADANAKIEVVVGCSTIEN